uniref:Uncharacterized protein n=1 Tax=Amphimedon queenslandica TaxID=400682 RepID=A0A1X7V762_AMPQE
MSSLRSIHPMSNRPNSVPNFQILLRIVINGILLERKLFSICECQKLILPQIAWFSHIGSHLNKDNSTAAVSLTVIM